jgi:hypothetical protein
MSLAILSTARRPVTVAFTSFITLSVGGQSALPEDYAFVLRTCPAVGACNDSALIRFA